MATCRGESVALAALLAAALTCSVRDRWIGSDFRSRYGRLTLIANNSRCLMFPAGPSPNAGSRVLSLVEPASALTGLRASATPASAQVSVPRTWLGCAASPSACATHSSKRAKASQQEPRRWLRTPAAFSMISG
ncbi:MAG: DUF4338 domain-containing protein [Betaproteobacteria bacterium]|nr:DUF4338 domain-containing protein [Betaproteobacteria bacterium]